LGQEADEKLAREPTQATMRVLLALLAMLGGFPALAAPPQLVGPLEQGGLMIGHAPGVTKVKLDDAPIEVGPDGYFLIGFARKHANRAVLALTFQDGSHWKRILKIRSRRYATQRIDGLEPDKVTPPPRTLARIRREVAQIRSARAHFYKRLDFLHGFHWPAIGPVTGVYGSQRVLNGKPRRPHFGLDIAAPFGAPVRAPAGGIVTMLQPDNYFSGRTLILDHGLGLTSTYMHLSASRVKLGQRVEQGQIIASVGATGRATGPHLDWRINLLATRLDPRLLLPKNPYTPHVKAKTGMLRQSR